jgi:hypothetical protein
MNYQAAHNLFATARYPSRGKPLEGSKNLRLHCRGNTYYVELWQDPILMIKPRVTYFNVAYDSMTTRRHINNLAPTFSVQSEGSMLFAWSGNYRGKENGYYLIESNQWYCSTHYAVRDQGMGLSKLSSDGSHILQFHARQTIVPRRKVPDERVILDPRRGQTFYLKGKTYIWLETRGKGKLQAHEYMGDADSWSKRYVYVGGVNTALDPNNSMWQFKAHDLIKSKAAVPTVSYMGTGDSTATWNLGYPL